MHSFPGIIFSLALWVVFQASGLAAQSLDIFNTTQPFPQKLSGRIDQAR